MLSISPKPGSWGSLFIASAGLPTSGHVCPGFVLPSPRQTQQQPEISCNLFCFTCNLSHAGKEERNRLPLSRSKKPQQPCDVSLHYTPLAPLRPPPSCLLQWGRCLHPSVAFLLPMAHLLAFRGDLVEGGGGASPSRELRGSRTLPHNKVEPNPGMRQRAGDAAKETTGHWGTLDL